MRSRTLLVERGTVGRVEDAYRHYIGGGQSAEPTGYTVHWQPDTTRGEWEQFVPFGRGRSELRISPGDQVLALTNESGGLVLAFVVAEQVCHSCVAIPDEELVALARNRGARSGSALEDPTQP